MRREEDYLDFRESFAKGIINLAKKNENVIYVECDIPSPARTWFLENLPEQYLNTGVMEACTASLIGGLASEGYTVYWYTYAFLVAEAYNQIKQSIAKNEYDVKIFGYNAGVSGLGGSSHNCVEDLALMRALPKTTIYAPTSIDELEKLVGETYKIGGLVYVRFPWGEHKCCCPRFSLGKDVTIVSCGALVKETAEAQELLRGLGYDVGVYNLSRVKPMEKLLIENVARHSSE